MYWWIGAILVGLLSAVCIISTMVEIISGKKRLFEAESVGAIVFHGVTAILALWFLFKALD
jgi:hypothetical protein